ncbi:SRPBCC family protein [Maribacter sp. 2-571]|uniref:SRPBCC family protein n=1 Tax=Maribacter sp. 2-571 TaxID=3417569 RepID=UPI003D326954
MKTLKLLGFVVLFAIGAGNQNATAQNPNAKLTYTKVVNKSADDVWEIIRELDDIDKYSSAVASVKFTGEKGAGGQRVCSTPDGKGFFKENILSFDDTNRTYTYAVVEGVPVKGLVNNFKVVDLGYNKSMIVWWSNYDAFMENPQMNEEQFKGFMNSSIDEMSTKMAEKA